MDSNHRLAESKSAALPLGYAPSIGLMESVSIGPLALRKITRSPSKMGGMGGLRPPHAARAARGFMPAALPARAHPGIWRRLFGEASKNPFVRGTAPQGARDDLSHAKASPRPLPPPRDKSACVPRRSPRQSKTRPAPRPWSRNAPGLWRPPSSTAPQRQASSAVCCRTA